MDRLVPAIVSEDDWKRFWDAARKKLKTDASIKFQKKIRYVIDWNEGISSDYDDDWFKEIRERKQHRKIIRKV